MRWAWYVARMAKRKAYGVLMGNSEGKRPVGTSRSKWYDNIKLDLGDRMRWYGLTVWY
jgi:hypothetical protein